MATSNIDLVRQWRHCQHSGGKEEPETASDASWQTSRSQTLARCGQRETLDKVQCCRERVYRAGGLCI
jgi:hypothetical protein